MFLCMCLCGSNTFTLFKTNTKNNFYVDTLEEKYNSTQDCKGNTCINLHIYLDEDIRVTLSVGYRLSKLVVVDVPRYRYGDDYFT